MLQKMRENFCNRLQSPSFALTFRKVYMHKQSATYRLFASLFALLLLAAPITQTLAYGVSAEQFQQLAKSQGVENGADEDDKSSEETQLHAPSSVQAIITAGIQLDFDLISYLSDVPDLVTPLKEFVQVPDLPTQSVYIQNICAYCIAPHAP